MNAADECRRDSGMAAREFTVGLSSRDGFIGDVRELAVAVVVAGRGAIWSFSSILSAALDFRTGYLGVVLSLWFGGGLRATSGLTEGMVGEGSDGRPRNGRD
jgi:hypothetical protein